MSVSLMPARNLMKRGTSVRHPGRRSVVQWLWLIHLVAVALISFRAAPTRAAITVDNASSGNGGNANVSSLSFSHTVNSGSNRILLVGVHTRDGNTTVNSVTWGTGSACAGTCDPTTCLCALTLVGLAVAPGNKNMVQIWQLLAPPVATANVTITINPAKNIAAGAVSYFGVDQTTPLGTPVTNAGTASPATVTVSSARGELVVDAVSVDGDALSLTAAAGQTQQYNTETGTKGGNIIAGGSTKAGAASVTMSWTLGTNKDWSIIAVALKPAAADTPTIVIG